MNDNFKDNKRHIIPRWRDFFTTLSIRELESSKKKKHNIVNSQDIILIQEKAKIWDMKKSISTASDLISSAIVFNEHDYAKNAAKFIIDQNKFVPYEVIKHAKYILGEEDEDLSTCDKQEINEIKLRSAIKRLKYLTVEYPYNSINWVDLALLYTNFGLLQKADRCIKIATAISRDNRFVLRSASRFYFHNKDPERALYILRNSNIIKIDPWVMAAEIAIASSINKTSKNIKAANDFINSENYSPFSLSELESSIGTIEFEYGNAKLAKKMIKMSLEDPNDNSLAQAIFLSKDITNLVNDGKMIESCKCAFEAEAIYNYIKGNWEKAFINCEEWQKDIQHSSRPVTLGSYIASSILMDFTKSEKIINRGLVTNPFDKILINNLIYTKLCLNKIDDAKKLFNILDMRNLKKYEAICLKATKGMFYYRTGNPSEGQKEYQRAIDLCFDKEDMNRKISAYIHLAYEEKRLGISSWVKFYEIAKKHVKRSDDLAMKKVFEVKFDDSVLSSGVK